MNDEVLELDVQLDKKTLDRFLLRNNFLRAGGVIGILISLAAVVGLLVFWKYFSSSQRVILIFLGLMFTVIQPLTLLLKGRSQLKTGAFREPFHYTFTKTGMTVENMAGTVEVKWTDMRKVIVTKEAVYLYMNAVSAFIIPRQACGENYVRLAKLIGEKQR